MNILLINYEYPPLGGGAGNATYHLGQALRQLGHEVSVVTAAHGQLEDETDETGVRVLRVPCARARPDRSNPREMLSFLRAACQRVPEIARSRNFHGAIVFFTLPCGPVAVRLKRQSGLPYIVSLRGGDVPGLVPSLRWLHWLLTPWRRIVLADAAAIIANDDGLAELSRAADPFPVAVIPNGVDCDYFQPAASGTRSPAVPLRWLYCGRMHAQKNLCHLLDAFARMSMSVGPHDELHLVGDGPLRPSLERQATRLGIAGQVQWHGWVDRTALKSLYQSADVFLNPSHYEGMPNAVLEAMACALPVIASNIPSHVTLARGGSTALLIDLQESGALTRAMIALRDDNILRCRLGHTAREMVAAEYSWTRTAQSYLNCLSATLDTT